MSGLPTLPMQDGITRTLQVTFGGYEHRRGSTNGAIWDMQNMSSNEYPLLAPRKPRYLCGTLETPNGLYGDDGLFEVDGTNLYYQGELVGEVEDSRKKWASLGDYVAILPDMVVYNKESGELSTMASSVTLTKVWFMNGTIYDEDAESNTIHCGSVDFNDYFSEGDAVTISGCTEHAENNTSAIIREISEDGTDLRFYEYCWTLDEDDDGNPEDYMETGEITIAREVPEMDYILSNENRLWGCKDDTIYASKLGDPFNWNVFDGLSTDSYAVEVGSAGSFTGCCSYLGYPVFFKEEQIYKVYGEKPSAYEVMGSATLGVEEGSWASPAIAGEVLYYLARSGIVAYSGGVPSILSTAFGEARYKDAVGGSDGVKYYVSMQDTDGEWSLFAYDRRYSLWHREDSLQVIAFAYSDELYMLDADGNIWISGEAREAPDDAVQEDPVEWYAEWTDLYEYTSTSSKSTTLIPYAKNLTKLLLRAELEEGSTMTVRLLFDSIDSEYGWVTAAELDSSVKRSWYIPIVPRRTDHFRLRLEGTGMCRIYSLTREFAIGSGNRIY